MTGLDWLILVFVLAMGFWGYQQGLLVGALSLAGFALGAFAGSRLGPALLPDGSESPYAPATALVGALLVGGVVAVSLEGVTTRRRHALNCCFCIELAGATADRGRPRETVAASQPEDGKSGQCEIQNNARRTFGAAARCW